MDDSLYDEARFIIDNYDHPQPGVYYTLTRVPGKDAPDALFEHFGCGCVCTNLECNDDVNCSCLKLGPNYRKLDGELVLESDKFGDLPVFECNLRCRCFEGVDDVNELRRKCRNRCVQFGPCESLEVFTTTGKGLGVRSTRRIQSGRFICEYAGEVIGLEEAKIRQARNGAKGQMNYIFILREHFNDSQVVTCVDPTNIGNIGRYINHSCRPNSAIVPVRTSTFIPLLCIFAIRDIEEGEEICFDYGSGNGGIDGENRKPCLCGSEVCKKWLPFQIV
ncbi:UNVERIFIED_CONTAM: hypothetical protein PYX00_007590 [Menopon gallinae]|uniref:Histone-lysine N-methyltransferase SETMAR n=1 Tax=Menopon gallinae TaxID=328185 RepID=A0AAW2HKU6_9NEOP